MNNRAYLSLGTNIEPRLNYLEDAIIFLEKHEDIVVAKKSTIYETTPVGYSEQDDFLNMVIEVRTSLSSMELLDYCQRVELELGRTREIRFGPRTIDLDILIFNKEDSTAERLTIPHPRMHERAFVLIPLEEIAPDILIPKWCRSVSDMIKQLLESDIKGVREWTQHESVEE
ncbi:2-amino-4-hydroxy-6-hydroxymethyldihydropteridine diphosphokinase [Oceanobacillus bengalensis]|uniref:2-amino-4-hydroxy-6-hydroxymethyldihydropteridine diphosphokinase n=1 Tax=Oceanobacillus bengalensis TaxID=1435466 RepID=A0A494YUD1_9BACI|nr:2-amino-4-hydroxy-6-hydroxymethyldihydropteridine diphosphokinase [Oceanobacillus bengalensis]RKQ13707.1 2-amino-4-hydroxy-6-hydroxymethyldihydropteridine diphosphokinase [Oceanobacillus bengalensis]